MKSVHTPIGSRQHASVVDAKNNNKYAQVSHTIRSGVIEDVYTIDNTGAIPYGAYTLYTVRLAPSGQWIENVPAIMHGGHYNNTFSVPNYGPDNPDMQTPPPDVQNCEETPYVVGQPVIIGFLSDSQLNAVILGPAPTQWGKSKQTSANYPMKWGRHQKTEWFIDKDGKAEVDFQQTADLTIKVNGVVLCYIKDGEVDLGAPNGDAGLEPTVLGTTLQTFLNSVFNAISGHTHSGVSTGPGTSGPPVGVSVPTVTAAKVKVK